MARTKKSRRIQMAPHYAGFEPYGAPSHSEGKVTITYEEYEALKLCDYELLTQAEAAELMQVSRPTFTRIYESVRRKVAKAFIEGSGIRFEEGNAQIVSWYRCESCQIAFSVTKKSGSCCPFCQKELVTENNQ